MPPGNNEEAGRRIGSTRTPWVFGSALLLLVLVGASSSAGTTTVVVEASVPWYSYGARNIADSLTHKISFGPDFAGRLFRDLELTPADEGSMYCADRSTEPRFDTAVERLTDGLDDHVYFKAALLPDDTHSIRIHPFESQLFGSVQGGNGIDLQGFEIDEICIRIDRLRLDTPGSNPNGDGIWTDVELESTLTVFDYPEANGIPTVGPFGIAVLVGSLLGFGLFTIRRSRNQAV